MNRPRPHSQETQSTLKTIKTEILESKIKFFSQNTKNTEKTKYLGLPRIFFNKNTEKTIRTWTDLGHIAKKLKTPKKPLKQRVLIKKLYFWPKTPKTPKIPSIWVYLESFLMKTPKTPKKPIGPHSQETTMGHMGTTMRQLCIWAFSGPPQIYNQIKIETFECLAMPGGDRDIAVGTQWQWERSTFSVHWPLLVSPNCKWELLLTNSENTIKTKLLGPFFLFSSSFL